MDDAGIAWLAGIIDGEGTITVQARSLKDGSLRITPFVCITNTDEGIIRHCAEVLDRFGIKHDIYLKPIGAIATNLPCWMMRVAAGKKLKKLLPLLIPHLRSVKRVYAEKILQFLELRSDLMIPKEGGGVGRRGYTRAELELIASVRTHKSRKTLEQMCMAPNVVN